MSRGLDAQQKAELQMRHKRIATLIDLELATPVRVWNGIGDVNVGGKLYYGVGSFAFIDGIGTEQSTVGSSISCGLYGIPAGPGLGKGDIVKATRTQSYQGKALVIQGIFTHPETDIPITKPFPWWRGTADVMSFQLGETISVSLSADHYSSMLRRVNGLRMTTHSHNLRLGRTASSSFDLFYQYNHRLNSKPKVLP